MPETVQAATTEQERSAAWNRDLRERVGEPLRPTALRSVLIAIPGSSGDIVLTTTLIRWIKERNPACKVSFAVKRSNLPLVAMCLGVDEALELPTFQATPERSKREQYLTHYAGRADAVIYPVTTFEDMPDLLGRYDFLEAMWLMAGVPDGMPPGPRPLWLTPPDDPDAVARRVLARCLGRAQASRLAALSVRQPGKIIERIRRLRSVKEVGWREAPTDAAHLIRNAALVCRLSAQPLPPDLAGRFVIVSSEALALPVESRRLFPAVIRSLRAQGRVVLHNVLDPARALAGTVPLVCSYAEFLGLRGAGIPFVGWRSGLCDVAAVSPAPMAVVYPETLAQCVPLRHLTRRRPVDLFSFAAMGVPAHCVDLICDRDGSVDLEQMAAILAPRK